MSVAPGNERGSVPFDLHGRRYELLERRGWHDAQESGSSASGWSEATTHEGSSSRRRCLYAGLATSLTVVVGLGFSLRPALNLAAKETLERQGQEALGVQVGVRDAQVEFYPPRLWLADLSIASSPGFEDDLVRADQLRMDVELQPTLSGGRRHYEFREVNLRNLKAFIGERQDGSSNLDTIVHRIKAHEAAERGEAPDALHESQSESSALGQRSEAEQSAPSVGMPQRPKGQLPKPVTVVVGKLNVTNITLRLHCPPLSDSDGPLTYRLHQLLVENVGEPGEGVTLKEFWAIMLRALLNAALRDLPDNVVASLPRGVAQFANVTLGLGGAVTADLGQGLEKVGDILGSARQGAGTQLGSGLSAAKSQLKEAEKQAEKAFGQLLTGGGSGGEASEHQGLASRFGKAVQAGEAAGEAAGTALAEGMRDAAAHASEEPSGSSEGSHSNLRGKLAGLATGLASGLATEAGHAGEKLANRTRAAQEAVQHHLKHQDELQAGQSAVSEQSDHSGGGPLGSLASGLKKKAVAAGESLLSEAKEAEEKMLKEAQQ